MSPAAWSANSARVEADAIAEQSWARSQQVLDASKPRDVVVGYTIRSGCNPCYVGTRSMTGVDVLTAVATILDDLALAPHVLIVRRIECAGDVPALLVAPYGRGDAAHPPRVVAIVRVGLTELDLNLALMRLGPGGTV